MSKVYVACYGSLRLGMGNERVNYYANAEWVGRGKTVEKFTMYRYCFGFPSVSLTAENPPSELTVDVFETTQEGLTGPYDRLEGYPTFYDRSLVDVRLESGEMVKAWIYVIEEETGPVVESGDWCLYRDEGYYDRNVQPLNKSSEWRT